MPLSPCTIPWVCRLCGTGGRVDMTPPANGWENRETRLRTLFSRTQRQHPEHIIVNLFWDFPACWTTYEFPNEQTKTT